MAGWSSSLSRERLSLEEFLHLPEESPALEFIEGRIEAKMSPQKKHGRIARLLLQRLNGFAEPRGLGEAFPELRCTFAGRSIVPDVVFLLEAHIPGDEQGEVADATLLAPDLLVEIVSPDQSARQSHEKLAHATAHGSALGWLIDPYRKAIDVFRPGRPPERLAADGVLEGEPVLPGFRLAASEVFGWLARRPPNPGSGPGAGDVPA